MISKKRADQLSNMPKLIDEDWQWRFDERKNKYEGEVKVKCLPENVTLTLVGWINRRERYSFSVIHKGAIPIRRWGNHNGHRNPNDERLDGPHKHTWREDVGTSHAYFADDVSTENVDKAFFDFLEEENIEFEGTYYKFEESRIDDWM